VTRRSDPAQQGPPEGAELHGFPTCRGDLPVTWFREHAAREGADDRGCWWFSSHRSRAEPQGRFDLAAPHGTCYLGETAGVAVRERCGRFLAARLPVPVTHLAGRVVSEVALDPPPAPVADLTAPAGAGFGVTGELAGGNDYTLSASWAQALFGAGFEAVLYQPRFTPGRERALGLFGAAGPAPDRAPIVSVTDLASVVAGLGFAVASIPPTRGVSVEDDAEPDDI
jgi:hypothetical protein